MAGVVSTSVGPGPEPSRGSRGPGGFRLSWQVGWHGASSKSPLSQTGPLPLRSAPQRSPGRWPKCGVDCQPGFSPAGKESRLHLPSSPGVGQKSVRGQVPSALTLSLGPSPAALTCGPRSCCSRSPAGRSGAWTGSPCPRGGACQQQWGPDPQPWTFVGGEASGPPRVTR